jgi:quinol monooxygenase YgiN
MANKTFEVVATYTAAEGREDDVLLCLHELAKASRNEEGNLRYEFFQGVEDPRRIVILESYRTPGDFQTHRESAHFQRIGAERIIPLLGNHTVASYESSSS